jgi:DNA-binding transcriptional LysR family regulator
MADELVVVMSPDHPWAGRRTITLEALRAEPMILRERGSGSREALERALRGVNLDLRAFRVVGEMGSTQAVKQGVRAGVGVSLVSRRAVVDECTAGLVASAELEGLVVTRDFYLVTHRHRSLSPLGQAFLEFVESEVAERAS